MTRNEELIKIRDEEKRIYLLHEKKSKFLALFYILGYVLGFILFFVIAGIYSDTKPRDTVYITLFTISMVILGISTILLAIWVYHFVNIKIHKRKMDEASYELTHRVMNHIDN